MIFLDSNLPMYLVGAAHPNRGRAASLVRQMIARSERLVTEAEAFQEILHRYCAIERARCTRPCKKFSPALQRRARTRLLYVQACCEGKVPAMTGRAASMATSDPYGASAALDFNALYREQWRPMLRLATGLLDEVDVAEDVVQDAFAALYRRAASLRDPGAAIGYLRVCVVNGTRAVTRRKILARNRLGTAQAPHDAAADEAVLLTAEHDLVRAALDKLPDRQREVLTLRFVAGLPDDDIAVATGLSEGGVRSASSRGLAALRTLLGGQL